MQLNRLLQTLLLLSTLLLLPATAAAEPNPLDTVLEVTAETPCEPEPIAGGIQCVVDDEPVFQWLHPTLFQEPSRYQDRREALWPAGPVQWDDGYYYSVGAELIRFEPQGRQFTERVRFPATIFELEATDDGLDVTIEAPPAQPGVDVQPDEGERVTISYDPEQGEPPGRGAFDWTATVGSLHDAMWLEGVDMEAEPGGAADEIGTDPDDDHRAVQMLSWRMGHDATNPYLPLYLGEAYQRLGEPEQAEEKFEQAVDHQQLDWLDGLRAALRLQMHGHDELANRAHQRSLERMEDAGVRGEYVTALVNTTFAAVWFQHLMSDAIGDGDVQRADAYARLLDETFPAMEGAPAAWTRLAAFFQEQDAGDLADQWRDRADEVRTVDRPDWIFEEAARTVDLYLMLQIGLLLTAVLAGAILGLWRYREDDEEEDDEDDDDDEGKNGPEGWRDYIPRFNPTDLVMLGGVFLLLVFLPMMVAPQVQSVATMVEAPPAASGDALAAPAVAGWVESLADSEPAAELLEESAAEFEATKQGTMGPGDVEINRALVEAVEADTAARGPNRLADVEVSQAAMHEFEWLAPLLDLEFGGQPLLLLILVLSANALIFGGLLQAVARRFEPVGRIGRVLIVGAPNSLRVLRLPVLAAFFVGVMLMTPFSRSIITSTEASMVSFYGLEAAPAVPDTTLATTGFVLVLVALVVHAVGLVKDRRN